MKIKRVLIRIPMTQRPNFMLNEAVTGMNHILTRKKAGRLLTVNSFDAWDSEIHLKS